MGREATVTAEQVHAIADAIKAEGGKPTSRAVRERLGSGSMGTIVKFLQSWKAGQERRTVAELALPPALQRVVLEFMETELAAARAPLEADLAEQLQTTADLASENERQNGMIEDQAAEIETLASEKSAAEGKAEQLVVDLASAKEEATRERQGAEHARTELAKAQLRLEAMPRLEADLATVREELAKERQGRIEAEQQAAVLAAQKTDLEGRLVDLKAQLEKISQQLQSVQVRADQQADTLADTRVTLQTAQARADDLAMQLEVSHKAVDLARREAKAAGEEAANLRGQIEGEGKGKKTKA